MKDFGVGHGGLPQRLCALAFGLIALATSTPALAFRSGRDLPDLNGTDRVSASALPIAFSLQKALPKGLKTADVETAIQSATSTWSAPACSAAQFSYAGLTDEHAAPGDGVNSIEWVSDWAARGFPEDAPGATDVQYLKQDERWSIVEADIYLNLAFAWSTNASPADDTKDVLAVVTHEVGHALGLLHPCEAGGANGAPACSTSFADSYSGATMYPFYSFTEAKLSQDDIDGVCFLYPKNACPDDGCGDGQTCTAEGCVAVCGGKNCALGEVCTAAGCQTEVPCNAKSCAGKACFTAAGCGALDHCVDGSCSVGERPNGDPCETGVECQEGGCINGTCSRQCGGAGACEKGQTCDSASGACVSPLLALGASCTDGATCTGGLCVAGATKAPICSRACGDNLPVCPAGWSCDHVDGQLACAPRETSDGCAISWGGSKSPVAPWGLVLAFAGLAARLRQKRERRS